MEQDPPAYPSTTSGVQWPNGQFQQPQDVRPGTPFHTSQMNGLHGPRTSMYQEGSPQMPAAPPSSPSNSNNETYIMQQQSQPQDNRWVFTPPNGGKATNVLSWDYVLYLHSELMACQKSYIALLEYVDEKFEKTENKNIKASKQPMVRIPLTYESRMRRNQFYLHETQAKMPRKQ